MDQSIKLEPKPQKGLRVSNLNSNQNLFLSSSSWNGVGSFLKFFLPFHSKEISTEARGKAKDSLQSTPLSDKARDESFVQFLKVK